MGFIRQFSPVDNEKSYPLLNLYLFPYPCSRDFVPIPTRRSGPTRSRPLRFFPNIDRVWSNHTLKARYKSQNPLHFRFIRGN